MLANIQIGSARRHRGLTVFPLYARATGPMTYQWSNEALRDQTLIIREIDEEGAVAEVQAENRGEATVLLLEGQSLVGAKQDRVLTNSVLLPGQTRILLPVHCVEHGRWDYRSRHFQFGDWLASPRLRWIQRRKMRCGLGTRGDDTAGQREVWTEIHSRQEAWALQSKTKSLADTFASVRREAHEFCCRLGYAAKATGLLAFGNDMVSIDIFDQPAICQQLWDRLLTGFVPDVLDTRDEFPPPQYAEACDLLRELHEAPWRRRSTVGAGQEYRARSRCRRAALRLELQSSDVHVSLVGPRSPRLVRELAAPRQSVGFPMKWEPLSDHSSATLVDGRLHNI